MRSYHLNYEFRDSRSSKYATYSCKHKITGRQICATPCDGFSESCEGDSDERCEGPGLPLVLLFTFISVLSFLVTSFTFDYYKKCTDDDHDNEEASDYNVNEWGRQKMLNKCCNCEQIEI